MYIRSNQYLESRMKEVFKRKRIRTHKEECLQELKQLLEVEKIRIEDGEISLCSWIIDSYLTYRKLLKINPRIKEFYNQNYHITYLEARRFAYYGFLKELSIEEIKANYLKERPLPTYRENVLIDLAILDERVSYLSKKEKKTSQGFQLLREQKKIQKSFY